MKKFFVIFSFFLIISTVFPQDYNPSNCDWENNSENCFLLAKIAFMKEKEALDTEIANLQKQNDDVTTQINEEMNSVNQKVSDLQIQMDEFQKDMDKAFENMIPTDLMDELNEDVYILENSF